MDKIHILIVEDDHSISTFMAAALNMNGYIPHIAANGADALEQSKTVKPDLVLLDLGLPDMDGMEVLRRLRQTSQVPVIVLSARGGEGDKVRALDEGADDYIMKPFSTAVLLAKIQALLRRSQEPGNVDNLNWDTNDLNSLTNELTTPKGSVQLSPTESALLGVLITHLNQTVTKEQLLEWLWQGGKFLNDNTLNVNISRLRSKLATVNLNDNLRTERGIGYRLVTRHAK